MSPLAAKISDAINTAIATDRLVLPTMPEMALKVREVADDPNASIKDLTAVIANDAALTARIIKVTNCAIYRGAREIEDLSMALSRLGMTTTSTLAIGLAMEQMFQATTDFVDRRLRQVWSTSSEIAGLCNLYCKRLTKLRPEQATLAGLTHKIGVLPILSYAEENPTLLKDSITLDAVIRELHPHIGTQILSAWEFPTEIRRVPSEHLQFDREVAQADYADIVTAALLQASPHSFAELDMSTVGAFKRLNLDLDITHMQDIALKEEMSAAMGMLK